MRFPAPLYWGKKIKKAAVRNAGGFPSTACGWVTPLWPWLPPPWKDEEGTGQRRMRLPHACLPRERHQGKQAGRGTRPASAPGVCTFLVLKCPQAESWWPWCWILEGGWRNAPARRLWGPESPPHRAQHHPHLTSLNVWAGPMQDGDRDWGGDTHLGTCRAPRWYPDGKGPEGPGRTAPLCRIWGQTPRVLQVQPRMPRVLFSPLASSRAFGREVKHFLLSPPSLSEMKNLILVFTAPPRWINPFLASPSPGKSCESNAGPSGSYCSNSCFSPAALCKVL